MSKVTLNVATESRELPAGTIAGQLRYTILSAGTEVQHQDLDDISATFDGIDAGSYTATVQRLDSAGNVLGDAASADFVVPSVGAADTSGVSGDTVAVQIPSTLTATVE